MSVANPLREGQFMIDGLKFGTGTVYDVSSWDTGGYDVAPGDYQPSRQDNLRFGNDFFVPTAVTWEIACRRNKYLENLAFVPGSRPALAGGINAVDQLHRIWKADDTRQVYGGVKFVTYKRDGVERRFYGRPRQFASGARTAKSEWIPIVCNFQRIDTITYAEEERTVATLANAQADLIRGDGVANSWVNIFIVGPIANPIVTIGTQQIKFPGVAVASGKVINISSYPWERRVINSDGLNLRSKLTEPYLDQVYLYPGFNGKFGLSGTGTDGNTFATIAWREAYNTL